MSRYALVHSMFEVAACRGITILAVLYCAASSALAQGPITPVANGTMVMRPLDLFQHDELAHVAFVDHATPSGTMPLGMTHTRSEDRGRSWTTRRFSTSGDARFAADGLHLTAFIQEGGLTTCVSSFDGGSSWSASASTSSSGIPVAAANASGASHLLVRHANTGQLEYLRSPTGGRSWPSPPVAIGRSSSRVELRVDGSLVHVAWFDGFGATYLRSPNLGQTFDPPRLFVSSPIDQIFLEAAGGIVHFAGVGSGLVQYWRSTDGGGTWGAPALVGAAVRCAFAVDGSRLWCARDDAWISAHSVSVSADLGATWTTYPLGAHPANTLYVTADGPSAAVVAQSNGGGYTISVTADGGASWRMRTDNSRSANGPAWIGGATVAVVEYANLDAVIRISRNAGATWDADRSLGTPYIGITRSVVGFFAFPDTLTALFAVGQYQGIARLEARILFGHQPYGRAASGSGGFAPLLELDVEPLLGRRGAVELSSCVGGAMVLLGISQTGPANLSLGWGTLLVDRPATAFLGIASGGLGNPGAGSIAFPLLVPIDPTLRGTRWTWQGFARDGGVPGGFTTTRAIESWGL